MIWSPSRNFCFIHVPKTGGTAIEQAYKPHLRFGDVVLGGWPGGLDAWYEEHLSLAKHAHAWRVASHLGHGRFRQALSFAILREPLERLVSYYRWIRGFDHEGEIERSLRGHESFESFVEAGCEHLAPQADMVCDPASGMPLVTVLAPYPHLAQAWGEACGRLGIAAPLPVVNASVPLEVRITPRAREIVARRYAADVQLYGRALGRWRAQHRAVPALR